MDAFPTSSRVGAAEAFGIPSISVSADESSTKRTEQSSRPRARDSAQFSAEAMEALNRESPSDGQTAIGVRHAEGDKGRGSAQPEAEHAGSHLADGNAPTEEETEQLRSLRARDREVRAHENAHSAAAGSLAQGGPTYEFQKGPDGVSYAVGGEVQISLRSGSTPEESLRLAQQAQRAALAPARPSATDRSVAAQAAQMATAARAEIQSSRGAEVEEDQPSSEAEGASPTVEESQGPEAAASGDVEKAEGEDEARPDSDDQESESNRDARAQRTRAYSQNSTAEPVADILGAIFA